MPRKAVGSLLFVLGAVGLAASGCSSASEPASASGTTSPVVTAGEATTTPPTAPQQADLVDDQPGVTLPARWPSNLPRPDGALLQQSSATAPAGDAAGLPAGDWALFVVPSSRASDVSDAYEAKLGAAGLAVERRTVSSEGDEAIELRVSVDPAAVARLVQVGDQTVVAVTLAAG